MSAPAPPSAVAVAVDVAVFTVVDGILSVLLVQPRAGAFAGGWALPGGFVDEGETIEAAAVREAREETGLDVRLEQLLYVYSDPRRDPRKHTLSAVFVGRAAGEPSAGDDAAQARAFAWDALPSPLAFDHAAILADARRFLLTGARPRP